MEQNSELAKQFIDLWQKNFQNILGSEANLRQMQQFMGGLDSFYGKTTQQPAAADFSSQQHGDIAAQLSAICSRLDALEAKLGNDSGA